MKRTMIAILLLTALLLSACGAQHVHTWKNATCTEPETCEECGETRGKELGHRWQAGSCTEPEVCSRCGETRGEPLGHDWKEATCTQPETCSRCGETRGKELGHDWQVATCTEPAYCARCGQTEGAPLGHFAMPADYWTPSVCSRCGEEVAPVLTPDFVTYGLDKQIIGLNKTVDYKTLCYDDPSYSTVGRLTFVSYEVTPGDGKELEIRDGYEWRILKLEVSFSDANANDYGVSVAFSTEDYYDIRRHDDTLVYEDDGSDTFDVVYKGETYRCQLWLEGGFSDWVGDTTTYSCTVSAQLPVGYDGMIFGMRDKGINWPDDAYVFETDTTGSVYFRMN